jgi:hypothetical protein
MKNGVELPLERCPHCGIAKPRMPRVAEFQSKHATIFNINWNWTTYSCVSCGCVVLTQSIAGTFEIGAMWPEAVLISDSVPDRARDYLSQAIASQHAPAGAIMLTASSVDAMLKEKGLKSGTLNTRIDKAASDHLITSEMATWAHERRLDANDQRHSDDAAPLPNEDDAKRVIEFAQALAEFLYVLPAKVNRGRKLPGGENAPETKINLTADDVMRMR